MNKVFISYSRLDIDAVLYLEQIIGQQALVWRDQDKIYGGDKWPKILGEAIDSNNLMLLVWSKESAASHYVEFEWCTALALKKTIIPWLLDDTVLPPSLRSIQGFYSRIGGKVDQQLIKSLTQKSFSKSFARRNQVLEALDKITSTKAKIVAQAAKTIFSQNSWLVHGDVFQAGRDMHITIQQEKLKRPLT